MSEVIAAFPRMVRPAPDPLGLYVRLGRNDHTEFLDFLARGEAACFGTVFDPTLVIKRHREVRDQVLKHRLDAILDPKTQPAATQGGFSEAMGNLPWGVGRPHLAADFQDTAGRRLVAALGDFVLEHGFTQVLAPTHLLRSAEDEWFATDLEATRRLRNHLDRRGGAKVPVIYSLAVTYAMLRDAEQRHELISGLRGLPVSAVWLKVDGFGSDSTATGVRSYIEAAVDFHELGVPVIADHVGGLVGLSLMSFGATGGIAHGVTLGERFSSTHWRRPQSGEGFGMHQRVYIPQLDLLLKPAEARLLLERSARTRALFGCTDTTCCPRGVQDMLARPGHHFLHQRMGEVAKLSQAPERLRAGIFLEQTLRPASDRAVAAANTRWDDEALAKKTHEQRKRLDALRVALSHQVAKMPPQSFAFLPKTRAAREIPRELR